MTHQRRPPITRIVVAIAFLVIAGTTRSAHPESKAPRQKLDYRIQLSTVVKGFDGKTCWVHTRPGAIPPGTPGNPGKTPIVLITMQKVMLTRSDVFFGLHDLRTDNMGRNWVGPTGHSSLGRRQPTKQTAVVPCDFWPLWHAASGKLLGTGKTFYYTTKDQRHLARAPSETAYSAYDPIAGKWNPWKTLELPDDPKFKNASAGCAQRFDLPNGDILLPIYYRRRDQKEHRVTVCRCRFDGKTLRFIEHGDELELPPAEKHGDGFSEPSITRFDGRFYMTLRTVKYGYVTTSGDGLHFGPLRKWTFDNGADLGSYNTQQHWVTHSDGLFLVYTRRGLNNDHVIRHRAPLVIAEVDPRRVVVKRQTERILVPERGTRLGNFGITDVSPTETWITTVEWMQPVGVAKYGSDNSVFVAKLIWNRPNRVSIVDRKATRTTQNSRSQITDD